MRARNERRLLAVFVALCTGNNFKDCAVHWYGNFTVQDLFDAAAKLRIVAQGPNEVGAAAGAVLLCMPRTCRMCCTCTGDLSARMCMCSCMYIPWPHAQAAPDP